MKQLVIGVVFLLTVLNAIACDVCGGASGAFTTGLMPNQGYHFIGFRSSFRWYNSYPTPDGDGYRGVSHKFFNSNELIGRWNINRRFQLLGFVPFVYNQKTDSLTFSQNGLGDIQLIGTYVFVQSADSSENKFQQNGRIGLGVKMPTGKDFELGLDEMNLLPGTGSWDYTFNLNYMFMLKNKGLQSEASYTLKTQNRYAYKFGDAFSLSSVFFYNWKFSNSSRLIPQLGFYYQYNCKDRKMGIYSNDSFNGGSIFNLQVNLNFLIKQFGVAVQTSAPLIQNLNQGLVKQKGMFRVALNYYIK